MSIKAIILHSGGMDSSICLALAIREFGADQVLALHCNYAQRHNIELAIANKICESWGVAQQTLNIDFYREITQDALTHHDLEIQHQEGQAPNTLVMGRNGLMLRLAAIKAHHVGAHYVYAGVIEVESANSGYRDCSRDYVDKTQEILRIDLDDPQFEIRTPVIFMTKKETLELAQQLGVLEFLLRETVTCYNGILQRGCQTCPACVLRNEGLREFQTAHPEFKAPY